MSRNKKPLIDGDIMLYRCGFAADAQAKRDRLGITKENNIFGEEAAAALASIEYEDWAIANLKSAVEDVMNNFDNKDYTFVLSGPDNFREAIATIKPYKGNRDPSNKPKYYGLLKEYATKYLSAVFSEGVEADDLLGTMQWAAKDKSTCIVSTDKDLDMIPGHHYNWVKKEHYYVDLTSANQWFFMQMLIGDPVDNIPGIKDIGPVRAKKIVGAAEGELGRVREQVIAQYQKQYGDNWLTPYTEVGNLLWIQRVKDQRCPLL